jgi:hypothetical protein
MSDKELKLTQKLFAVVEGLVKATKVHSINVHPESEHGAEGHVKEMDFSFEINHHSLDFDMTADVSPLPFSIPVETCEIVQQFNQPPIYDASLENIETRIIDEQVENIIHTSVQGLESTDIRFDADTKVHDLFKLYNIKPKLAYDTPVKSINPQWQKINTYDIPCTLKTRVKENTRFFKRLTVERHSVEMSLLAEKDQLIFWRNAVLKTKKEPKQLKLLGVYTGVPYPYIETQKITMNPTKKTLTYVFNSKTPKKSDPEQLKDIALFTTISPETPGKKPPLILVKK